jgi:hypothetical protein
VTLILVASGPATQPNAQELARVICEPVGELHTRLRASDELITLPADATIPAMLANIPDLPENSGDDPDKLVRAMIGQLDPRELSPRQQASHAIIQTMLKLRGKLGEKRYAQTMFAHRDRAKSVWARELVLNAVAVEWIDEAEAPLLAALRDTDATPSLRSIAAWRLLQHQRSKHLEEIRTLADVEKSLRAAFLERLLDRPEDAPVDPLVVVMTVESSVAATDEGDTMMKVVLLKDYLGETPEDFPDINRIKSSEVVPALKAWWSRHRHEFEPQAQAIRPQNPRRASATTNTR